MIPFHRPDLTSREIDAVAETVASGWLTSGPRVQQFEQEVSKRMNFRYAIAVNSATAGLHLLLHELGIGPGDLVIVPTLTFGATAAVVSHCGADVILCDVNAKSGLMDCVHLSYLMGRYGSNVKAVMPVHFAGASCDLECIRSIVGPRVSVIEDAAHAFGTTYNGLEIGAHPESHVVFSFYATKPICTGEGGMIVTHDEAMYNRLKFSRLHCMVGVTGDRYSKVGAEWEYDIKGVGFKYNMPDIAAAMGLIQLSREAEMRTRRQEIAHLYLNDLEGLPLQLPYCPLVDRHAWHLFVVHPWKVGRTLFIQRLKERGIGTSVHFKPLHRMTQWEQDLKDFPGAEKFFENCVSLPIWPGMVASDVLRVVDGVRYACTQDLTTLVASSS